MPRKTGAELVALALEAEKVPFAFGIPGAQNLELYDALDRSPSVRAVLVTDEQCASFMADGVSRSSEQLGCVNLVPGAGLTHALSGIAEAFMDGTPLLILACGVRSDSGKSFQLHDVAQLEIARPVTKAQFRVTDGATLYNLVRHACRVARSAPCGPVIVEIPAELYVFRHEADRAVEQVAVQAAREPILSDLTSAVERIEKCRRPLLYLGLGASGLGNDAVELAERLQSPVATTVQGKGVFPETHPLWV